MKLPLIIILTLTVILSHAQTFEWELYSPYGNYEFYEMNKTIKSDSEGNIYSVSYFKDSISVNGQMLYVDGTNQDMVIIKYDENRDILWFKEIDLNINTYHLGFDLDSNEDLIIASAISADTLILDNFVIDPVVGELGFLAKISKSGTTQWVKKIFDGYPLIRYLSLSDNDDIFVAGESWGGGLFARLDKEGYTFWKWDINSPGGGGNVWCSDIKPTPDGSAYGVLMFQSEQINVSQNITLFNPYPWGVQMVLFKFDSPGEIIWFSQNTQGRFEDEVRFEIDHLSNVYLIGSFHNAPLQLGDLELPPPPNNRIYGFISKCGSEGEWEWLTQRDPWPNFSIDIELDCQNEVIYSTGLKSLEVFSILGNLENQIIFNEGNTRCFSLEIGINNNILLSGVTNDSIIGNGGFDWYNPFIISVDYNSVISYEDCITTSIKSPLTQSDNLKIYPTIINDHLTIEVHNPPPNDLDLIFSTINGKVFYKKRILVNNLDKISLSTVNFPVGVFVITIISKDKTISKRAIKLN